MILARSAVLSLVIVSFAAPLRAQTDPQPPVQPPTPPGHEHHHMAAEGWTWMYEGVVFAGVNSQGGKRGADEFRSQNWLMAMASRPLGRAQLSLTGMFSAEPLTVRPEGYSQLFQLGEAFQGRENVDRQHPHDLFAQLGASVRVPFGESFALTLAGAPVGEATLGPVVFMHRPSASENPIAPLGHHTLDSTHIASSVVALALDAGPLTIEGSVFRGREPDEHRYDLELGEPDSWATRIWFRPLASVTLQASYGFLRNPEQLVPGNVTRRTASIAWLRESGAGDFLAASAMIGHNQRTYSEGAAFLAESTLRRGMNSIYGRFEILNVETEHLLFPSVVHVSHPGEIIDRPLAYTAGYVRDFVRTSAFELGIGGDATFYSVPDRLLETHGKNPGSYHLFVRFRPRTSGMARMWDMTMLRPMR